MRWSVLCLGGAVIAGFFGCSTDSLPATDLVVSYEVVVPQDRYAAKHYIRAQGAPIVVKADGLAAGKGVVVAETVDQALAAIDDLGAALGGAAAEWVIEEKLMGQEASFHALVDGTHALPLAAAQDHKAVGEGDTGPNTGGMGAYSPTPAVDEAMAAEIMSRVIEPTVAAMAAEGRPFKGVLYAELQLLLCLQKKFVN